MNCGGSYGILTNLTPLLKVGLEVSQWATLMAVALTTKIKDDFLDDYIKSLVERMAVVQC